MLRRDTHLRYGKCKGTNGGLGRVEESIDGQAKTILETTLVRLTDHEYRQLTDRAKQSGVSPSRLLVESTLRQSVTNEEKQRAGRLIEQRDWAITQVVRVGNNLNQIARQLNSQRGTISARRIEQCSARPMNFCANCVSGWSMGSRIAR